MDTILVAITVLSLVIASVMGAMLMRTWRIERRRSEARVALLQEMAASRPGYDFEMRPRAAGAAPGPEIFGNHDQPSAWPRRFAVIGVLAALSSGVVLGWRALNHSGADASNNLATAATAADAAPPAAQFEGAPAPAVGAASQQPLELLSLQHAQQGTTLVISGLVQNPRAGAALARVQATVVLLDADGRTLNSGRAALDFTTLGPGDESPFVIRVADAGAVARYRVGFRGADDRVLGHVDRRNIEAVARKQAP